MSNRRRKRNVIPRGYVYIAAVLLLMIFAFGSILYIKKYGETKDHLDLAEYFVLKDEKQAAVILNTDYIEVPADVKHSYAIYNDGHVYLQLDFLKDYLDDGYVYDNDEITLRYATDAEVYTANVGSSNYQVDKSVSDLGYNIVVAQDDTVYIAVDYVKLLTDIQYTYFADPNRVLIEKAGFTKETTTAKAKGQIRKLNGPKSPILEDVEKGETITLIRDTGKWSFVMSENGVMGYIKNKKLGEKSEVTIETTLAERNYKHISFGKDISMAWHQVTGTAANGDIANVLASVGNVNVMSPTWFYLNDNKGGIANLGSSNYVNYCHENGIQVWALVSNLEDDSVDTTTVLNTTSSRDKLVNNLIAAAITYGLDGINIDFEELSGNAKDGFIQFIRELSIKCEKNDIILSVDNYVPTASSACYNRTEQAKYVDYVVIMAYDEHYGSSQEAGSVASLGWVNEGVRATLNEVPAEQVVLGIPFYCRVWEIDSSNQVSSKAYGISGIKSYIKSNDLTTSWDESAGQYYAEHVKDNSTFKVWVEDETSIEEKLKVMDSYNLAGAAYWKLGFDNDGIWNVIAKYF